MEAKEAGNKCGIKIVVTFEEEEELWKKDTEKNMFSGMTVIMTFWPRKLHEYLLYIYLLESCKYRFYVAVASKKVSSVGNPDSW